MDTKHKVLIIKTGYSETFTPEIGETVSLGDVLRTTALLHLYKDKEVTWLTSEEAIPILYGNPFIKELLIYNLSNSLRLQQEEFDIVINLEKVPGLCALADTIKAWQRYGYRFNKRAGCADAYLQATEGLYVAIDGDRKNANHKHWLELLFEVVGEKWSGEGYVLGYKPRSIERYDIGLNYRVGNKFERKAWSHDRWHSIYHSMREYTCSWQPQETTISDYIDWVNECRLLITNDSLGLHVAMALGKLVVGIFGPTPAKEIQPYERGQMIQEVNMDLVTVGQVEEKVRCLLPKS